MKNILKVGSIIILMIFSFYYTEKIAIYAQNNTPLKKAIVVFKNNNSVASLNASINGNEITPGINGLTVNVEKSYNSMRTYNTFIENNIVYEEVKPNVSVSDYPDKIITSGNPQKRAVSIIISSNNINIDYLKENNIRYTNINNTKYCLINQDNNCMFSRQKVKLSTVLNNSNFIKNIDTIKSGSLIFIDDNLDQLYLDILIKHIKFYNLNILKLDDHLNESNNI